MPKRSPARRRCRSAPSALVTTSVTPSRQTRSTGGSPFRHPEYLTARDQPTNRVRCPIHGFIHYSDNEREIINHRLFQRLRYIRQLALTEFVYPGANHTRFEHALGVMEAATRAFDSLATRFGDLFEAEFRAVAGLEVQPLAMARQSLRLAALLHDTGHAAFSHAAEVAVHAAGHEALSKQLIAEREYFGRLLDQKYGAGMAALVANVLEGQPALPPQLQVLNNLVSGEMDADRSDYLLRDSHHCGVDYGRFDFKRLIESIVLYNSSGGLELALHSDGLHAFEALILARYQMSTQVYYHRLRRIYDRYLINYHRALGADAFDSAEKIVQENDTTMLARIMKDSSRSDERGKWAQRIVTRNHHKLVFEPGVHVGGGHDLICATIVFGAVRAKFDQFEFIDDIPSKAFGVHKLLAPDAEQGTGTDLMLITRDAAKRPVISSSQILSKIPRTFRPIRLFGNVEDRAVTS